MTKITEKKRSANPAKRAHLLLSTRHIPSINDMHSDTTIFFLCSGMDGKILKRTIYERAGQTLYCLACAGEHGITEEEVESWELSESISELRDCYHLDIESINEIDDYGDRKTRYILRSWVQIYNVEHPWSK